MAEKYHSHTDNNQNANDPKKIAVKRAYKLVDSVNDLLEGQLSKGLFRIQQTQKPLKIKVQVKETKEEIQEREKNKSKIKGSKRSMSVLNSTLTLDMDQHKRLVKRFIRMSKKIRRNQQIRSVEMQQKSRKQLLDFQRSKQQQKNNALIARRNQIQKRRSQKQLMLKQIQKSMFQERERVKSLRQKKFLYQQKQQEFRKKYILPKLEQEENVLAQKKKLSKPMDMNQIISHEKKYTEELIHSRVNRQMHSRMIAQQWNYQPPAFVPKSYIISEQQRQLKKAEEQLKARQKPYNQIKKKQFLEALDQLRQAQKQKSLSSSKKDFKQARSPKVQLSRQETKNIGNQYMKEFLKNIDRSKLKQKKWPGMVEQEQRKAKLAANKKTYTQYQLQLIKEERIQKVQKIRFRKIQEISHDKNATDLEKYTKLIQQAKRLDRQVSMSSVKSNNQLNRDQCASIIINSIHAKLATLEIQKPSQQG